jgi:hypothetical protein
VGQRRAGLPAGAAPEPGRAGRGRRRRRGATGAWRARRARWPAIAVGCLEDDAWPRDSGTALDTPERVDPRSLRDGLAFALALVRALDEDLGRRVAVAG